MYTGQENKNRPGDAFFKVFKVFYNFKSFYFLAKLHSMWDLPMRPGMETMPPTEEARTSRGVLELGDS